MKNDLRSFLTIMDGNRVPSSVYYDYRNVSEISLFDRNVMQVSKDILTEGYGVNNLITESRRWNLCL